MADFSLVPADAPPDPGQGAAVKAAVTGRNFSLSPVDPKLGAVAKGVSGGGRASDMMLTESFQPHPPAGPKLSKLPFTHQAILSMMDNKEEKRSFLEQQYGKGSVTEDSKGMIVKDKDGKSYRASSSFMAHLVGDAPETMLGIAGAAEGGVAGAVAGPAGAFVGAVGGGMAGAAAGKTLKEGAKAATGNYHKKPGEYAREVAGAAEAGAMGEVGGKVVGGVVGKLTRGPLPGLITGANAETRAMTDKVLRGGARPPAQSTMPDAKKLQRIAIIADKLSGPSKAIDRANRGYLHQAAGKILDKVGLKGGVKQSTLTSMESSDSAISTQQTGQMIQGAAKSVIQNFQASLLKPTGQTVKGIAYLKQLVGSAKSPEDAYNQLVHSGQTDKLEKFIQLVGKNSPVTQAVQQQALRHAFAGAMEEAGEGGMKGLTGWMSQFTEKQQKLLFPGGLHGDLQTLDKEIKFLYPGTKDPSMAGMTSGAMMQKKFYERWYHQGVGALYRSMLQQPAVIRRLAIGFKGDSSQRAAARMGLREMFYFGALEASEPDLDKQQK